MKIGRIVEDTSTEAAILMPSDTPFLNLEDTEYSKRMKFLENKQIHVDEAVEDLKR